jgi:hypothetical protein
MFRRFLLFSPDDAPGTSAPVPDGTPPPAASVVQAGTMGEADASELVRLRQEKADLERKVKDRECRVSELEDQAHIMKSIHRQAEPKRTPRGAWTFFHRGEDQD